MKTCTLILLIFIMLSIPSISCGECYWDETSLLLMETPTPKAQSNLLSYDYVTQDASDGKHPVLYARIRKNQVIVWFGGHIDTPGLINVYDLSGEFLYGYRVLFDIGNGFINTNIYQDDLLVYFTAANCVYRFRPDDVEFYYSPPEHASIFVRGDREDRKEGQQYPRIQSTDDCRVTIYDQNGKSVVIVDHSKEYLATHPDRGWVNLALAIAGITIPVAVIGIDLYRTSSRRIK